MKTLYSVGDNEKHASWLAKASSADSAWAMSKARSYREADATPISTVSALHDLNSTSGVPHGDPPLMNLPACNSPPALPWWRGKAAATVVAEAKREAPTHIAGSLM